MSKSILGIDLSDEEYAEHLVHLKGEPHGKLHKLINIRMREFADVAVVSQIGTHEYNRGYYECLQEFSDLRELS